MLQLIVFLFFVNSFASKEDQSLIDYVEEACKDMDQLKQNIFINNRIESAEVEFQQNKEGQTYQGITEKNIQNKNLKLINIHNKKFNILDYLKNLVKNSDFYKKESFQVCVYNKVNNQIQDLFLIFDKEKITLTSELKKFMQLSNQRRLEAYKELAFQLTQFNKEKIVHSFITPHSFVTEDKDFSSFNLSDLQNQGKEQQKASKNILTFTSDIQKFENEQFFELTNSYDIYSLAMSIIFIENSNKNCMDVVDKYTQIYQKENNKLEKIKSIQKYNIDQFLNENYNYQKKRNFIVRFFQWIIKKIMNLFGYKSNNFYDIIEQAIKQESQRITSDQLLEDLKQLDVEEIQLSESEITEMMNNRKICKNKLIQNYQNEKDKNNKNMYKNIYRQIFFFEDISLNDFTNNVETEKEKKSKEIEGNNDQQQQQKIQTDNKHKASTEQKNSKNNVVTGSLSFSISLQREKQNPNQKEQNAKNNKKDEQISKSQYYKKKTNSNEYFIEKPQRKRNKSDGEYYASKTKSKFIVV